MKISKKYLLVGLISLFILLVPHGTYAMVTDYYGELKYSDSNIDLQEQYKNEINLITEYIEQNGLAGRNLTDGKYVIVYKLNTFNTSSKEVLLIDMSKSSNYIQNTYQNNNRSNSNIKIYYGFASNTFNIINNEVVKVGGDITGNNFFYSYYEDFNCNPTQENCQIYYNSIVFNTNYLYNSYTLLLKQLDSNTIYDVPLKVGNIIHLTSIQLNAKDFFDSLGPQQEQLYCSRSQVLGAVSNVSSITFNVKGVSNALSEQLNGKITLSYEHSSILSSNDFDVSFSSNEDFVTGDHDLNCSTEQQYCELTYSYNYQDDIDTELDLNFTIKTISGVSMPYFIRMYACTKDDVNNTTFTYSYSNLSPSSSDDNSGLINNFLQDGNLPDVSGLVDTSLVPAGPLDSILLLPLNVMQALLNVLNSSTCRPLVLPLPFVNQNLTLPCISTIYSQINGLNVFLNWFSAIFSAYILYQYFIYLYKWVDDTLTLRENTHFGGY